MENKLRIYVCEQDNLESQLRDRIRFRIDIAQLVIELVRAIFMLVALWYFFTHSWF
jgi:hypothetical protein